VYAGVSQDPDRKGRIRRVGGRAFKKGLAGTVTRSRSCALRNETLSMSNGFEKDPQPDVSV
jgi:hypothetical protein